MQNKLLYSETSDFIRRLIPVWWQRWLAIAGLWTTVALISSAHWHLLLSDVDPWVDGELVRVKLQVWFVWAILTPLILWIGYQLRFDRVRPILSILGLTVLSLLITAFYVLTYTWILYINFGYPREGRFEYLFHFVLTQHSSYYFLAFWVTIGIEQLLIAYRRWHDRELLASQLQAQLARAQFRALKSQVQPHFLFNVLNTISSSILEGDRDKAHQMTAKLSDLLRMVLDRNEQEFVTVASEMEFNRRYLELMAERFEPRLVFQIQTSPESLTGLVPEFLLQPLVENAVTHGVANRTGESSVMVQSVVSDGRLQIAIEEQGEKSDASEIPGSGGRGHRLTEDRLRQYYGSDFRFVVTALAHTGMRINIDIPFNADPAKGIA
ncbi:MAG: histidine kinase [bacterium]|nr:histidine kinase [bacterium]